MATLKVGIIGLGGIARSHCDAIATLDNVEVVAVADLFEEKRRQYMDEYGIPRGYTSHTELLKDDEIDAVAVVLGHHLHHRLTVDACNAGKHVLVEKPMALSLEQCDAMIDAAASNSVKLMVGHTPHFSGILLKMKEILDSGRLGPLMTIVCYSCKNWTYAHRAPQYRSRFHGGGMWLTNGVHVVDRLTWLMASQAVSVSASIGTRAHYQAADDTATALIRYKNGLAGAAISIAFADGPPIMDTQVICANGTVRIGGGRQPFLQVGQGDVWQDIPYDDPPAVMHHEWKSFVESIEQDIEPPASGEWSRHIMEILFAAESSAITGQDVVLESGLSWTHQRGGIPVTRDHGWI